ncbi:MAG: lipoyl protein ligase domain-containing protein [Sodalis sp. (in: enterobacteria)]|uniref:lipoyl protein ligase domain-containing protein n=1 Tax=Sodalis sp. (in: enterobacteria) TaxID=1898979 RepID=UPI0039E37E46
MCHRPARRCRVVFFAGPPLRYCSDATRAEEGMYSATAAVQAVALVWHAPLSLVAPVSYRRFAGFAQVCQDFAADGCPVLLRKSGGGLVPQGPGIINLSLAYPTDHAFGDAAEDVYRHLCGILTDGLARLGIATGWQAVAGSFCDGRYNLACGSGAQARKIAGTAQYWRAAADPDGRRERRHIVLAYALLLVDCDLLAAHRLANEFESRLGTVRVYQVEKTVSVAQCLNAPVARLVASVADALITRIAGSRVPL